MDRLEELRGLNFKKLSLNDCEFIYKQGYFVVCNDGQVERIEEEQCYC